MKNKKMNIISMSVLSVSFALTLGAFGLAKPATPVSAENEIVLTCDEDVNYLDDNSNELIVRESSLKVTREEEKTSGSSRQSTGRKILGALKNTLKDALKALINYIKNFFKRF